MVSMLCRAAFMKSIQLPWTVLKFRQIALWTLKFDSAHRKITSLVRVVETGQRLTRSTIVVRRVNPVIVYTLCVTIVCAYYWWRLTTLIIVGRVNSYLLCYCYHFILTHLKPTWLWLFVKWMFFYKNFVTFSSEISVFLWRQYLHLWRS